MNRDKVTQLLKNYRSYKYAVSRYERHRSVPAAGIANYSGMSGGSGAQELFFAPNGRMADMGHTSYKDVLDYQAYSEVVKDIEGALEALTDEEQSVIKLKWVDQMSLQQIADRKNESVRTIKRRHKSALASLEVCFRFVQQPEIEEIPHRGSQHMRYGEDRRRTTEFY